MPPYLTRAETEVHAVARAGTMPAATEATTVAPAATTQPIDTAKLPTTNPSESDKVDVVIVVEKNNPTTEPALPTTTPTGP